MFNHLKDMKRTKSSNVACNPINGLNCAIATANNKSRTLHIDIERRKS